MRTRFLPIDYFGSPSSSTSYFSLPVPRLPPPPCLSSKRFLLFDLLPITDVHLDINNLKIEIALVKLLTDVIPHKIDVPGENFEPAFSSDEKDIANHGVESETEVIHGVKGATESYRSHELAAPEDRRSRHESKQCIVDKSVELTELVHFEIPELDVHLEGLHAFGIEHADIFSGFPPIENDMVGIKQVLEMHNNHEIEESVYSFEYIKLENLMEPQADLVEDECCVQGSSNFHLPLLEVNNISSGNFVFMSMEDDIATLFTKIEGQLLTQKEDFTIADEHILNFMECALLKSPSHDSPAIQCSETDLSSAEIFLDIDFINIGGILSPQENLSSYQGMQGGNQFLSLNPVVLEEFQTLEIGLAPIFDFFHSGKFHEHDPCKEMLKDGVIWKSLDDLVINHELALVDDMFRSLPIPVLPDKKAMELLHDITGKVYIGLELRPLSASDDIYLDWNLLEEDKCSSATFSFFLYMIRTIDFLSINFDWRTSSISEIVLDFVLSDFGSDELSVDESHKSTDIACSPGSVLNGHEEVASTESQFGHQVHTTHKRLPEDNFRRTSSVFNSMSPFNDLDFFLNPSKSGTDKKDTKPIMDSNGIIEKVQSNNSMEVHESPVWQFQKKDFILHQVHLSDDLIAITVNMERIYLDILERNAELKSLHCSFQEVDAFRLLSISKLVFIDCIKNLGRQKPLLRARGEMIITCSTLCAIKQIAWYLCFYGISTAQSYLDKLCEGFDFFASRLSAFQKFLTDNDGQPGMVRASSHPSLLFIQDILISSTNQNGFKALVVADKVFCSALKLLLTSLGISFTQLNEFTKYPIRGLSDHVDFSNQNTEFLQEKVCFLAYPENISADFPFNKFKMILEYGGSCSTSRIITLFPEFSGHPCLHFLKVEINKLSAAQALCEGVGMPQQIIMEVERETQFVKCVEEYIDLSKLEALLNFVPLLDEMGNSNTKFLADPSIPHEAFSAEANNNWTGIMSFPEIVIIMNTLSTEKEMIVSRRSTYQKILALEEMGAQVIERDSNLPADIIISPTACLVWYECSNMQTKSSGPHEVSSWLPCYVEDIATNILSFLSYSFSCCILIFEGESDFLSNVMETSDGLYAAAASLGVDLQLFCSYSAELTDEIILSCIGIGTRLIKGLFPKIPEAETLAESFLSKFPSINPLTAHSIISNGGILADFLGWSYESRVNAVKKYHVPDESISLFSALCRYGEREDSQSIMTDTSSSVSSGPDTRKYYGDLGSENKRCKYTVVPPNRGKPPDVLLQGGSSKQYIDSTLAFHEISKVDAWESSKDKLTDRKGHESSLKKIVEKEELDSTFTRFPPKFTDPLDCNLQKVMDLPNSSVKQSLHWNIASADPYLGIEEATISSLKWPSSRNADTMTEKVKGTIDLVDHAVFNPIDFSFLVQDMNGDSTTEPEYSFGHGDLRTFPTAAEIESSPCCTSPAKHKKYSSMGGGVDYKIPSHQHKNETSHLKYESALTTAGFDERSSINIPSTAIRRDGSNFRGTPLRDALHSSHLQKGSPWTMEFLNRIREKSKLHQRSLLPEASPSLSIRKNIPNRTKRRSPSILEFFKDQGGSTVRKIPKQKRQKTTSQSLGSFKNEKAISISMSGTPDDKRARRKLSYTTNEIGSQTRLVWSERSTYNRA